MLLFRNLTSIFLASAIYFISPLPLQSPWVFLLYVSEYIVLGQFSLVTSEPFQRIDSFISGKSECLSLFLSLLCYSLSFNSFTLFWYFSSRTAVIGISAFFCVPVFHLYQFISFHFFFYFIFIFFVVLLIFSMLFRFAFESNLVCPVIQLFFFNMILSFSPISFIRKINSNFISTLFWGTFLFLAFVFLIRVLINILLCLLKVLCSCFL